MFAAKKSSRNETLETILNSHNPTYLTSSILDTLATHSSHVEPKRRTNISQMPRPAPRKQVFETKDSDLNNDIEELLAIS